MYYSAIMDAYEPHVIFCSDRYAASTPAGQWTGPVRHRTWVLDFAIASDLEIRVEDEPAFTWAPYTWLLYRPEVTYFTRYRRAVKPHVAMWWLFTMPEPAFVPVEHRCTILHDPQEVLAEKVRGLYRIQEQGGPGWRLMLKGGLLEVLGRIEIAAAGTGAGTVAAPWVVADEGGGAAKAAVGTEAGEDLLAQVDRIAGARLRRPPSVAELAGALHMSASSLSHRLKATSGWTVVDRIRWLRIREARRMLGGSGRSVKEVGRSLGFSSQGYFSRVFRAVTGIWPSEVGRGELGQG
ncbi:MAG TPA: helix-turn-helix transcriptional regulator [Planctomycetota bacterium]|nr:helix-turn-helix transcriptional regulator [Planctomycetota bacterium]